MITLKNLSYAYGKSRNFAISDITAEIEPGIHLLLGENGAGKTTLLHIIAGLLIPTPATECTIDGVAPGLRRPSTMQRVFFVSDNMRYPFPTINEMVRNHSIYFPNFNNDILRRNLELFGMTGNEPIDAFSLGNRKKAILAYAFALKTDILLLDEPANGLDITAKQLTLSIMSECIDEGQTVILSTHTISDFAQLFDSVTLLSAGKMVINKPVWEITEKIDFVNTQLPPENALYIEQAFGRFRAIVAHEAGTDTTDIDYTLLYNALQSVTSRHNLIKLINSES